MITWLVLAAIALALGGWVAARVVRRGERPAIPAAARDTPLLERTVREVRPGDVVQHDGADWLVEGVVTYDEDGHTWRAAHLADGGRVRWLLVGLERGGPLTIRLLEEAPDVALTGYPPEAIARGGESYRLVQRGTATAAFQGDVGGMAPAGEAGSMRCRWWRYGAPGDRVLLVEQWGDTYRAFVGEGIRPDGVELLAAS